MTATEPPVRVLLAKLGLDGHDRGIKVVARLLRDAGVEVVLLGLRQTTDSIVRAAEEEDVDVIGISSLATDHLIVPKLMAALGDAGLGDVRVVIGGIVPENEEAALVASGVRAVFHPGSTLDEITTRIRDYAGETRRARAAAEGPP